MLLPDEGLLRLDDRLQEVRPVKYLVEDVHLGVICRLENESSEEMEVGVLFESHTGRVVQENRELGRAVGAQLLVGVSLLCVAKLAETG